MCVNLHCMSCSRCCCCLRAPPGQLEGSVCLCVAVILWSLSSYVSHLWQWCLYFELQMQLLIKKQQYFLSLPRCAKMLTFIFFIFGTPAVLEISLLTTPWCLIYTLTGCKIVRAFLTLCFSICRANSSAFTIDSVKHLTSGCFKTSSKQLLLKKVKL